jgi:LacI family transcriptional regulator
MQNPHFWQTAEGVEQAARAGGYHLLLSSMDLNPQVGQDVFRDLSRRRIDGLILMGRFIARSPAAQDTLSELLARHLPIVEITDHYRVEYDVDSVSSDYYEVTSVLMSHLLSLGHQRIGLIYGVGTARDMGLDRLEPYQASLRAAGLPPAPDLLVECGTTIEDGYQAARQLLSQAAPPTAIIAINDLLAMGVLRAAGDLGLKVPDNLSLVSYDDIPAAEYLVPRLTTATKDAFHLGREAVKLLLARLEDPGRRRQTLGVPARVIFRESTGPAPRQ